MCGIRECAEIFAAHQKIDLLLEVCYLFVDAFYFLYRCVIVNSFLDFINHQFLHSILFHSRVLSAASLQLRICPPRLGGGGGIQVGIWWVWVVDKPEQFESVVE